ncbi:MAG: hypothetical protein GW898_10350 [Thiomicrospira sp.]|nr:hypothetical protein [Thiomicrospira sp.]NCN66303.1 hypothetical protein [Thiomicrospira sp.]NCO14756.1 hypothetical protein [Thiomicrospira sp.]NCO82353.1 hypothetical protein [Thiomicrospira sp.]OIP95180.1 MAG: hypothetical protein AUK56_06495 [Thiomicrospira sp. CG2_30_44_34]
MNSFFFNDDLDKKMNTVLKVIIVGRAAFWPLMIQIVAAAVTINAIWFTIGLAMIVFPAIVYVEYQKFLNAEKQGEFEPISRRIVPNGSKELDSDEQYKAAGEVFNTDPIVKAKMNTILEEAGKLTFYDVFNLYLFLLYQREKRNQ